MLQHEVKPRFARDLNFFPAGEDLNGGAAAGAG